MALLTWVSYWKTPHQIYLWVNIERTATALWLMPEQSPFSARAFPGQVPCGHLAVKTADSTAALHLGPFFKSEIFKNQKNPQKEKNMVLNRPQKGHLLIVWELKQEGSYSVWQGSLWLTSPGNICVVTKIFLVIDMSTHPQMSPEGPWVMIWELK